MNSFLQAIKFLTRLAIAKDSESHAGLSGEAVSGYAAVGLVIGFLIAMAAGVLSQFVLPPSLVGIVVLVVWVGVTGALHLDGLADCADAWMGGHTPERMLHIMKDTACGVGAIVAVVLVLLTKFVAVSTLLQQTDWILLVFPPVIARITLSFVVCAIPYIRHDGIGASLHANISTKAVGISALVLSIVLGLLSAHSFIIAVIASAMAFSVIYYCFIKRVGGATGDIYGALVETTETFVLIGLVIGS